MKKLILILIFMANAVIAEAALIDENESVAVMDLEIQSGNIDYDTDAMNAEMACTEYLIQQIVSLKKFNVIDKDLVYDKLKVANIERRGNIDPDTAKRIGEILNVRYLIYGNVLSLTVNSETSTAQFSEFKSSTVCAVVVIKILDTSNGRILMAAKGYGFDSNSLADVFFIQIGSEKVSQTSVHNAIKQAAFKATDELVKRLFKL